MAAINLEGDELVFQTPAGIQIALSLTEIKTIDFSSGNVKYLSEMKWESVKWRPFIHTSLKGGRLESLNLPRLDQAFDRDALRVDGVAYSRGLAIRSQTKLTYRLPAGFTKFRTIAGIDDRYRENGFVRLVVKGDGKSLFEQDIPRPDADQLDSAEDINVDITGVRRLTILVDFGDGSDISDHLDLCKARITK